MKSFSLSCAGLLFSGFAGGAKVDQKVGEDLSRPAQIDVQALEHAAAFDDRAARFPERAGLPGAKLEAPDGVLEGTGLRFHDSDSRRRPASRHPGSTRAALSGFPRILLTDVAGQARSYSDPMAEELRSADPLFAFDADLVGATTSALCCGLSMRTRSSRQLPRQDEWASSTSDQIWSCPGPDPGRDSVAKGGGNQCRS
jgi:hypothetical protein